MTNTKQNKGDGVDENFKSDFLSDAERAQQKLDTVSPSMCLAKWKQLSLHLTTGMNNSCYHPPLHRADAEAIKSNPSALHNTVYKKKQRKLMLEGTRPPECSYCWAMEDNNKLSDRHYRSGEPWAIKDFETIKNAPWDQDITPSYVEVDFNSACNLSCSYCSPQYSSSWMKETKREGAWPTSTPHNDPNHFQGERRPIPAREHNPYVEAFWEWWPTLYPELEHFRMTGGEPMMDRNTYRVFDHVLQNPSPKLHLSTTSNFSVEEKLWQKYKAYVTMLCEKPNTVEHFMQYVSLDGMFEAAEYMRHGLNFNLLWDRVNQFLNDIPERNSITFIITMNNLSITTLKNLFAGILGLRQIYSNTYQRIWFDTPVLRTPTWQSLQILPESYVHELELCKMWMDDNLEKPEKRFKGFKDYEVARLDRDIAWMRNGQQLDGDYINKNKADFYRFFNEHDRRRGTNFIKTFPDMNTWWEECKYLANNR
jgi:organic radical activating enzyme